MFHLDIARRKRLSETILEKFPNKFPIVVFLANGGIMKIIAPHDILVYEIKRKIEAFTGEKLQGYYLSIGNYIPSNHSSVLVLYHTKKSEDGFLYIQVRKESTFG